MAGAPILVVACVLAFLVCVVFLPILGFAFMEYDVSTKVINNPYIRDLNVENLTHILTSRCVVSYYPVRTLSYAVDYQFWGLNPAGFKLTNVLIHVGNVLLLFWLVIRLLRRPGDGASSRGRQWSLPAASFSAGLLAIHPIVVEPVTWVAGREELLAALGALGTIHFHLSARRVAEDGGRGLRVSAYHAAAAACCAAACLSNALAVVIPAVITAYDLITLGRQRWRSILYGTCALWLIGAATIVILKHGTTAVDHTTEPLGVHSEMVGKLAEIDGNNPGQAGALSAERLMLVLNVYWLNLGTLVRPVNLGFWYSPVAPESFLDAGVVLGGVALGLTCGILWVLRRRKLILFGLLWFGLALAPSSQIMVHHIHRADRLLYMPLVGLAVAAGIGLKELAGVLKEPIAKRGLIVACVLGLVLLAILSVGQVQTWRDNVTVWENSLRLNPENSMAHAALSMEWTNRGRLDLAAEHQQEQMRLDWNNETIMRLTGLWLATCEEPSRNYESAVKFATQACRITQWNDLQCRQALAVVHHSFAQSLAGGGEQGRAIRHWRMALEADPDYRPALRQLEKYRERIAAGDGVE